MTNRRDQRLCRYKHYIYRSRCLHRKPKELSCKMVWGLIPKYFKPEESCNHDRLFNKQIESFDQKIQYFYQLLSTKRCALVFVGFYEWKVIAGKKQPYYIHLSDKPMQMAGIYEDSQIVRSQYERKEVCSNVQYCHLRAVREV